MRALAQAVSALLIALLLGGCNTLKPATPASTAEPRFDPTRVGPARWALVLSSGSIRGYAHIGVVRVLEEEGLKPDLIVGTSAGAIVGALAAAEATPGEVDRAASAIGPYLFMDWTRPHAGLLGGSKIHAFMDENLRRHNIEEFPIRFAVVVVEAERACLDIFNAGDVGKAVQASATVPVMLAPPEIKGKHYFDGALASPLPVRIARALGAQRVVAVDVTFDPGERGFHSIVDSFWRATLVMRWALSTSEGAEADLLIEPILPPEREITIANRADLVAAGERAMRAALPRLRELLRNKSNRPASVTPDALSRMVCPELGEALKTLGRQ